MVPYLFDLLGFFVERIVERVIARGICRGLPCITITSSGIRLPRAGAPGPGGLRAIRIAFRCVVS